MISKRFAPIPGFDGMKMKRDIQTKIHKETKHMTREQRLEYYRAGAKALRRRGSAVTGAAESILVKEEGPVYGKKKQIKK